MATPMILDTAEPDPRSHQGYADVMRDMLIAAARQTATQADFATTRRARPEIFALPMGAPALTTHDVQQSGAETAIADLNLAALTAEFIDFRMRVDRNFVRHAEQAATDRARIRQLESLVQEREGEITVLRGRTTKAEDRLSTIEDHNNQIANEVAALVLARRSLLDLVKAAPQLLALVPHEEG